MRCDIDAKGKAVRLILGIAVALIGLVLVVGWASGVLRAEWAAVVAWALVIVGGFMIVEGLAGWCAVRAMGFRTRV